MQPLFQVSLFLIRKEKQESTQTTSALLSPYLKRFSIVFEKFFYKILTGEQIYFLSILFQFRIVLVWRRDYIDISCHELSIQRNTAKHGASEMNKNEASSQCFYLLAEIQHQKPTPVCEHQYK